jgi:hypothetical protein
MEWSEQVRNLVEAPNEAHEAISWIYTTFGELHMRLSEAGDLDTAHLVSAAYNQAKAIYDQGLVYAQAFATGRALISELDFQRLEAFKELNALLRAIREVNEAHPHLRLYAEQIRENERATVLDSDDYLDDAVSVAEDSLRVRIFTTFSRHGLGGKYRAGQTLDMLLGKRGIDEQQLAALRAFIDTVS